MTLQSGADSIAFLGCVMRSGARDPRLLLGPFRIPQALPNGRHAQLGACPRRSVKGDDCRL
jgi:hypothetical protein